MVEAASSIFTEKATEKLLSPDDLDNYVRVTNPSGWVTLGACVFIFVGLFTWAFFGTVSTGVGAAGTCLEGRVVAFVGEEQVSEVHPGDEATVGDARMKVVSVGEAPVSYGGALGMLDSEYLASRLVGDGWAYVVRFEDDGGGYSNLREGVPLEVNILTERVAPITLIFGGNDA